MSRHLARWGTVGLVAALGCALVAAGPSQGQTVQASAPAAVSKATPRDGRIVVYDANADQLVTLNPDGSARIPVTPAGESAFHPAWAPNGSRIAFASNHAGDDIRIFTVKADGTDLRQVTHDSPGVNHFTPAYSADGTHILFSRCRPDPPGGCTIYSVRTDGTSRKALTTATDGEQADFWPDASPDGRRIAFTRFDYRGIQVQTWVMPANGGRAHPITTPRLEGGVARWLNDSRHLVFTSLFAHVGDNIYRMRDDGSQLKKLTQARYPHNAQFASPSPSGAHIVFADDRAYPGVIGGDLFVMGPGGGGQHAISHDGRLLENDWGTAPLVNPSSVKTRSGVAPTSKSQRAKTLSPAVAALLARTGTPGMTGPSRRTPR
jgi:Tol biopolymer transport system component